MEESAKIFNVPDFIGDFCKGEMEKTVSPSRIEFNPNNTGSFLFKIHYNGGDVRNTD